MKIIQVIIIIIALFSSNYIFANHFFVMKFNQDGDKVSELIGSASSAGLGFASHGQPLNVVVGVRDMSFFVKGMKESTNSNKLLSTQFDNEFNFISNQLYNETVYTSSEIKDAEGFLYTLVHFNHELESWGSTFKANGGNDILLIKFNRKNEVVWANQIGSTEDDLASSIILDAMGNVLITGQIGVDFKVSNTRLNAESTINIWPNPSTDLIYYESSILYSSYKIIDIQGRALIESSLKDKKGSINLGNLPAGLYNISFYDHEKKIYTFKKLHLLKN